MAALAGGALLGATAALTLATPAGATGSHEKGYEVAVSGKAGCDKETGDRFVEWTVTNKVKFIDAKLVLVQPEDAGLETIVVGATVPAGKSLGEKQTVANDATKASLKVGVEWHTHKGKKYHEGYKSVDIKGECKAPESPTPTPSETTPESPAPSESAAPSETPSESASPVPGGAGGDELPLTGASVGTAAGGAAVLLAAGGVLFYVFRRRRIRFTA
jgi:LPXTG-motif cell wall-anchored protein